MRRLTLTVVVCLVLVSFLPPGGASELNGKVVTAQFGGPGQDSARAVSVNAVAGHVWGSARNQEQAYLRYLRPSGAVNWSVRFGTRGRDRATAVAQVGQEIYVAGTTTGGLDRRRNAGARDGFLRAYSAMGSLIWGRQFGSPGDDVVTGIDVNGALGVVVTGWTTGDLDGTSAGGRDVFARLYSQTGSVTWSTQFGSPGDDTATAVDNDAPILIAGTTDGVLSGGASAGGLDAFAARIAPSDGSIVWMRQFGTPADDVATGVALLLGAEVLVAGTTGGVFPGATSMGGRDVFLAKFDDVDTPTLATVRQFGSPSDDSAAAMASGGGFAFLSGSTEGAFEGQAPFGGSDAWVMQIDFLADPLWIEQFGTATNDRALGISSELDTSVVSSSTFVVGDTDGAFAAQTALGGRDAFWTFRWPGGDALSKDVLQRGLAAAERYGQSNGGAFDGFTPAVASTLSLSYLFLNSSTPPVNPFEMSIGQASWNVVRLISWSPSGRYYCVEDAGGVITQGWSSAFDASTCSGGW